MPKKRRKVICLTPIKNEAWILEKFIDAAALWADHIIIADQNSTDGSDLIAKSHPKVIYIKNESTVFNEPERQQLLIKEARKLGDDNILIALDADEALSGLFHKLDWSSLQTAERGTALKFRWMNLKPGFKKFWLTSHRVFGMVDDGSSHHGRKIHSTRLPVSKESPTLKYDSVGVLHFQYVDWKRMESKHRWYIVWEFLNKTVKSPTLLYRKYNHMNLIEENDLLSVEEHMFSQYVESKIDFFNFNYIDDYYWDNEILKILVKENIGDLRRLPIWSKNWEKSAKNQHLPLNESYIDKRTVLIKLFHLWLQRSHKYSHSRLVIMIDKFLIRLGL